VIFVTALFLCGIGLLEPLGGAYLECRGRGGNAATLSAWVASNEMAVRLGLVSRPMKQLEFRDNGSNFEV